MFNVLVSIDKVTLQSALGTVTTWMGDYHYYYYYHHNPAVVNHFGTQPITAVNSAFHLSTVGKSRTGLPG